MYKPNYRSFWRLGSYGALLGFLLFTTTILSAQRATNNGFHMNVAIGHFTATGTGDWQGTIALVGSSEYVIDNVAANDVLFDENGKKFVVLVKSVIVAGYSVLIDVDELDAAGRPLSGRGALMRPTANMELLLPPANGSNFFSEETESKMLIDNFIEIDAAGGDSDFDGDRAILRVPEAGDNLGTTTVTDWLEWWYFVEPTITLSNPSSPVQVGTVTQYILSGSTTNDGGSTLSNGMLRVTSPATDTLVAFGAATSYADTISFEPQQDSTGQFKSFTFTFAAKQDWVFGSESGTATSSSRTITAVYPVLYGMSATDLSSTGDPYTALNKLVQAEGNKTVSLTGSGYIFYAVPKTWGDFTLSSIIDHNGFNVTPSFTSYDITVSSTGLTNDWNTVDYKLYKLNTTTITAGYAYTFNR